MALAAGSGYDLNDEIDRATRTGRYGPKEKDCPNCGNKFTSKKDYCSADCCKEYREKLKQST
jgi:hypothetical protein